nr:reverse transcriptase domain-containing protein [Tanacetum cinerariifolium]
MIVYISKGNQGSCKIRTTGISGERNQVRQQQSKHQQGGKKPEQTKKGKGAAIFIFQSWRRNVRPRSGANSPPQMDISFPLLTNVNLEEYPIVICAKIGGHDIHMIIVVIRRGPMVSVLLLLFRDEIEIPVCCDDDDDYSAITPSKPVDSLSIGDEHLNTISATESDKFIKSCVENLVPNPSEFEGENGCDVHAYFTTFSNVLFDADDESDSSDYQSCSDE